MLFEEKRLPVLLAKKRRNYLIEPDIFFVDIDDIGILFPFLNEVDKLIQDKAFAYAPVTDHHFYHGSTDIWFYSLNVSVSTIISWEVSYA